MPKTTKKRGASQVGPSRPSSAGPSRSSPVVYDVVTFLQRRRLEVPAVLAASCPDPPPPRAAAAADPLSSAEFQWAASLLTGVLKERERRALERFVKKRAAGDEADEKAAGGAVVPSAASEGEDEAGHVADGPPAVRGGKWPADVKYTHDYAWGDDVPHALRSACQPAAVRLRPARACARTFSAVITETAHPACGQCGLFAARALAHGAWVLDYVGAVSLGANEDRTSDYVCDFGEHSELALDAKAIGNEARFVNDYRNTGKRANVEFRLRRDTRGELRQGVFVCAKEGVAANDELLISYGKSYWRSRVGDLEEFIVRRPGEEAPS